MEIMLNACMHAFIDSAMASIGQSMHGDTYYGLFICMSRVRKCSFNALKCTLLNFVYSHNVHWDIQCIALGHAVHCTESHSALH